jgi:hypothetical protein
MSKNRNRAKLNKANNGKGYKIISSLINYPPYSEYDWTWKNRDFPNHKRRSYKTWKYNRKTQWKETN